MGVAKEITEEYVPLGIFIWVAELNTRVDGVVEKDIIEQEFNR